MSKTAKTIMIGLAVFAAVVAAIFVIYTMRQPTPSSSPSPIATPKVAASPSPTPAAVTPQVFEVGTGAACSLDFTVAAELTPGLGCVNKEIYKDVASNTAGTYTLTGNKLADNAQLVPGDKYVYVVNYKNTGTAAIDGKVADQLPEGLTYLDSTSTCTYASANRTITCTISSTAANATGQVMIRFSVDSPNTKTSFTNTATVTPTTGSASTCSITNPIKTLASTTPSASPTASIDCVNKRVYQDNAANTAGKYYLNTEIKDTNTLQDGQTVVFNVLIKNSGGAAAPDVKITDVLSSNLTFVDAESGCTYEASNRTVTCNVGSLAANTETSRSFRAKIGVSGTTAIANTANVSSSNGQNDSCSVMVNAAGQIVTPSSPIPTALPEAGVFEVTVGTLGIGMLLLIAGTLGLILL